MHSIPRFRLLGAALAVLLGGVVGSGALATAPIRHEARILVHIAPLLVEGENTHTLESHEVELVPGTGGKLDVDVPWDAGRSTVHLRLSGSGSPGPEGGVLTFELDAAVTAPGETSTHAVRTFSVQEGTESLFEVFQRDDLRLVLGVRAERVTKPVMERAPEVGPAVQFKLEIERAEGEKFTPLESNRLSTFVGHGVEYALRGGQGDSAESLKVVLTPVRLLGDLAEVDIQVAGSLPGTPTPLLLARTERLLTTRRATSSLLVVVGDPPAGYRFLLTPDF